jgi:hypothetical protein
MTTGSVVPTKFSSCPAKVPEKGRIVVPVRVPLSAAKPHAAGVWYVPLVICVPSDEIVALPVEVPVPRDPASVRVNDNVCPEIVASAESSPRTPLSHSPARPVNAPGTPSMSTTLDVSAVTVDPLCEKFASTRMLLAGFTFECATICHWPWRVAFDDMGVGFTGVGADVDAAPPPHPPRHTPTINTESNRAIRENDSRRSFIGRPYGEASRARSVSHVRVEATIFTITVFNSR